MRCENNNENHIIFMCFSCYIDLYIQLAISQMNTYPSRGGNKSINNQQGTDAKQLKQMLAVNNWSSESQVKINPVMPSMVFRVISAKFRALLLYCF